MNLRVGLAAMAGGRRGSSTRLRASTPEKPFRMPSISTRGRASLCKTHSSLRPLHNSAEVRRHISSAWSARFHWIVHLELPRVVIDTVVRDVNASGAGRVATTPTPHRVTIGLPATVWFVIQWRCWVAGDSLEQSPMTGKGTDVNVASTGLTGNGYQSVCLSVRE